MRRCIFIVAPRICPSTRPSILCAPGGSSSGPDAIDNRQADHRRKQYRIDPHVPVHRRPTLVGARVTISSFIRHAVRTACRPAHSPPSGIASRTSPASRNESRCARRIRLRSFATARSTIPGTTRWAWARSALGRVICGTFRNEWARRCHILPDLSPNDACVLSSRPTTLPASRERLAHHDRRFHMRRTLRSSYRPWSLGTPRHARVPR